MNSKIILLVVGILLAAGLVSAADCWQYESQGESACNGQDGCMWRADTWAAYGGWCEMKSCNSFSTSSDCSTLGGSLGCSWMAGNADWGWCEEKGCWNFWNSTLCTAASTTMGCQWDSTGNFCYKKGCEQYTSSSTCLAATDFNNNQCKWNTGSNYCYSEGCWNYFTQATCAGSSFGCEWDSVSQFCQEVNCWNFEYTSTAACENNSYNLSCIWNDPWCNKKGCTELNNQESCSAKTTCMWKTNANSGWCQKAECWQFDNITVTMNNPEGSTNESYCVNNSAGLGCAYNENGGWCYQSIINVGCSEYNNRTRDCMDTKFCMYDFITDECKDPMQMNIEGFDMDTDFVNPGCWILDLNSTRCDQVRGCTYNQEGQNCSNDLDENPDIAGGIKCEYINNSNFCNSVPFLGGCCLWNGTNCTKAQMTQNCWNNMDDPGDGMRFCEDYNTITSQANCNKIAGEPWYMPCKWDNSSSKCRFRMDDKGIDNVKKITNNKECDQAGGEWVQEYYCEGNASVPFGWCETKTGSGAKSCNQQCWACEFQDGSGNAVTSSNAKSSCEESQLGFCEFKADTNAPNGIGFCQPKQEFKAAGGNCDTDCAACTFMGNTLKGEPQQACKNSKASCKWFTDPDDNTKGWCDSSSKKTCAQKCSACFSQDSCVNIGGSNATATTSCAWQDGLCVASSNEQGGSTGNSEICFDGIDNDQNGRVDCDDSACVSETFCGGDMMGNCAMYMNNDSCLAQDNCAWIIDSLHGWCKGNGSLTQEECDLCNAATTQTDCNAVEHGGCLWENSSWCDMKGSQCWMQGRNGADACTATEGCTWFVPPEGGNCEVNDSIGMICNNMSIHDADDCTSGDRAGVCEWKPGQCAPDNEEDQDLQYCWRLMDQNMCNSADQGSSDCYWNTTKGFCDFKAWQCNNKNQSTCESAGYCQWSFDMMAGSEQCMPICFSNPMNQVDQATCTGGGNYSICKWSQGFCDPVGMKMSDCADYDTDQVQCQNQTGCMWMANPMGLACEVNETAQCWNLNVTGGCQANSECIVWNISGNARCEMKAWECDMNMSKHGDEEACLSNSYCSYDDTMGRCFPKCFNSTFYNLEACAAEPGCYASSGLCENKMAAMMYGNMMDSPPIELGWDTRNGSLQPYNDIRMFGIKDDKNNYGLGIGVWDVENASMCNGQKLQNGMAAKGENTTKFYWYLDTDGDDSNNCEGMSKNGLVSGFEFKFKYISGFESGSVTESRTAYKCMNGEWVAAEIKLSSQKSMMCQMLVGGMVAVSKGDLTAFQDLYSPTANMRMMVSAADASGSADSPVDSAGPSYYSPGQFDFGFEDCMYPEGDMDGDGLWAKDDPDCSMFQQFGFVKGEDCFAATGDEDGDGLTNCDDPDCRGFWYCVDNGLGVDAVNYSDTTAPKLMHQDVSVYPDGAFVAFDTDEPTNATLMFYSTNSVCTNDTLNTQNLTSPNVVKRHGITARNVTGGINYNFLNGTSYYYKLKLTDESNNTAISKCMNFTTTADSSKVNCPDCRIIVNFDSVPSGWNAEMYLNGIWYKKGNLSCGKAAGMLVWYNQSLHIRFLDGTTNEGIEFRDVMPRTLSGTSRNVSDNDMAKGTYDKAVGGTGAYVEAEKEKIDDLVDKLRPQSCRVYISGNNTELWHCYDVGTPSTCKNRTAEATKIAYNDTLGVSVWQIPKCEFSAWAEALPATSGGDDTTTTSSGGGGGGGGGAAPSLTKEFVKGRLIFEGKLGETVRYMLGGNSHSVRIESINADSVNLLIKSVLIQDTIKLGQTKVYDVDEDGKEDISINLAAITGDKARLAIYLLSYKAPKAEEAPVQEAVEQPEEPAAEEPPITGAVEEPEGEEKGGRMWFIIPVIAALAVVMSILFAAIRHKRQA